MVYVKNKVKRVFEVCLVFFYRLIGMKVAGTAKISLKSQLDTTHPRGVFIGEFTMITAGVLILSHDFVNQRKLKTKIGRNCFIGAKSVILPGVTVGDNCVIAAGSIVTSDLLPNGLYGGNPAKFIKEITVGEYGKKIDS